MHFITCFDSNWLQNKRWFNGTEEAPRGEDGRVAYLPASSRCFGYFSDRERALAAVERNEMDLHECRYTLCVVEYLPEGIHALGGENHLSWFRWQYVDDSRDEGCWVACEQPPETTNLCGFALG